MVTVQKHDGQAYSCCNDNVGRKKQRNVQSGFLMGTMFGILLTILIMTNQQQNHNLLLLSQQHYAQRPAGESEMMPGWQTVHVYYGQRNALEHLRDKSFDDNPSSTETTKRWYGQVKQDQIVVQRLLKNMTGGFFLDLAANDAYRMSNSYALEQPPYNWNGLCIEPNPDYWYGLSHRKCTIVGALVGKNASAPNARIPVQFRGTVGGIVGKMNDKLADRLQKPKTPTEYRYMASLRDILQHFRAPSVIQYMSLDVEGAEFLVMQDFPFDKYSIQIMTIERPTPEVKQLLQEHGFVFLKQLSTWGETLWAHSSMGFSPNDAIIQSIPAEQRKPANKK